MSIHDEIRQELKDALRSKDHNRLDVLRQVETEASKAKTAPGFSGAVDDDFYQKIIATYVKRMKKACDEYRQLGPKGTQMVQKLSFEVSYLGHWIPGKLDQAQTRKLVREAIVELGVSGPKAVGRVMGHIMKAHRDEVDGALVKRIASEELGS